MYFHILFYPQVFPQMFLNNNFQFLNTCTKQSFYVTPVGPMHCLWDPQTSFFSNFFIKNWSHSTIHTFKNYFAIMFSVFNKISGIQTDPYLKDLPKECIGWIRLKTSRDWIRRGLIKEPLSHVILSCNFLW